MTSNHEYSNLCPIIIGIGHPLIDIIVTNVDENIFDEYGLKKNDAILGNDKHRILFRQLMETKNSDKNVKFIPGGSVQNTIRICQWFFSESKKSMIIGCIGNDDYGKRLRNHLESIDQCSTLYCFDNDQRSTGKCLCLINVDDSNNNNHEDCYNHQQQQHNRSLITFLDACYGFRHEILVENLSLLQQAHIIYTSGFFMVSNFESVKFLIDLCQNSMVKFAFNLSAPYVIKNYLNRLFEILSSIDLLFGNESELIEMEKSLSKSSNELTEIIENLIKNYMKYNSLIIITQGSNDIIVGSCSMNRNNCTIRKFSVPKIPVNEIVDTNGAGDAFVGGFLAYYSTDTHSLDECIDAGIYAAQQIIRTCGCQIPETNELRLNLF